MILAIDLAWILFVLAGLMGLGSWWIYVWAVQDGQFKSVEESAERLLSQDAKD